jgi:hypothetical protein
MPERRENIIVGIVAKNREQKKEPLMGSLWQIGWLEMRYEQTAPPTVAL